MIDSPLADDDANISDPIPRLQSSNHYSHNYNIYNTNDDDDEDDELSSTAKAALVGCTVVGVMLVAILCSCLRSCTPCSSPCSQLWPTQTTTGTDTTVVDANSSFIVSLSETGCELKERDMRPSFSEATSALASDITSCGGRRSVDKRRVSAGENAEEHDVMKDWWGQQ
ncbi:uncharacterized protein LOC101852199 [Aplysia californica]|uniref:Uncharacterized protein LOC101852199 n=1 Tax=Aplysia californica TaxID=6500 RepID=A0ABM1A5L0_APLCA|nr:uncharacterized protein LOC101852199 [Aplysia californica]